MFSFSSAGASASLQQKQSHEHTPANGAPRGGSGRRGGHGGQRWSDRKRERELPTPAAPSEQASNKRLRAHSTDAALQNTRMVGIAGDDVRYGRCCCLCCALSLSTAADVVYYTSIYNITHKHTHTSTTANACARAR